MHPGGSGAVTLRRGDGLIGSDWRLGGASVSLLALSFSRGAGPSNYKVMLKLKSASSRLGGVTPPPHSHIPPSFALTTHHPELNWFCQDEASQDTASLLVSSLLLECAACSLT
ncbi:hypothetical protein CesoFtcFv8_022512 [Champsocephalus esox]|uniref:Uncharacterized protein n=1 Tax=Champsocephalus esox TaxID=159716 RepID=A0AAN8BAQ6_9TELE|nr:hypothetical protein CesoFtcFv8_022512 [Champsocephalus esox]